jgi:hypothetical protein
VERFLSRHAGAVIGRLSGFDRVVFRGTLRVLAACAGMMHYPRSVQVLLKDFAAHAQERRRQVKEASEVLAQRTGRPMRYLASSALDKEAIAREIAAADGIDHGLICILSAVEPCQSYDVVRDRAAKHIERVVRQRKCLYLYYITKMRGSASCRPASRPGSGSRSRCVSMAGSGWRSKWTRPASTTLRGTIASPGLRTPIGRSA